MAQQAAATAVRMVVVRHAHTLIFSLFSPIWRDSGRRCVRLHLALVSSVCVSEAPGNDDELYEEEFLLPSTATKQAKAAAQTKPPKVQPRPPPPTQTADDPLGERGDARQEAPPLFILSCR